MKTLKHLFTIIPESDENPERVQHKGLLIREDLNCVFATDYPRKIMTAAFEGYVFLPGYIYSLQ